MEYPFKDLLPLDEVLEREGYYKDWTHLDPKVFYSLTQISNYIKTKGYGVDVRLLIAQLAEHFSLKTSQINQIELFFKDVMQELAEEKDYHSLPEIAGARGGFDTLGERLNDTSTQLAQKADKTEVRMRNILIGVNDLDGETLGYLQDGAGGNTINVSSIPKADSVSVGQISDKAEANLFDGSTITTGGYIIGNGDIKSSGGYGYSDYIPVVSGQTYTVRRSYTSPGGMYDESKQWVGQLPAPSGIVDNWTFTVPANVAYVRVNLTLNLLDSYMMVEGSVYPTKYYPYGTKINWLKVGEKNLQHESVTKEKIKNYKLLNMFNKDTATTGAYIVSGVNIKADASYGYSDYIPVLPGRTYTVRRSFTSSGGMYDKNKNYIAKIPAPNTVVDYWSFSIPDEVYFVRVNFSRDLLDSYMMVEGSDYPSFYTHYGWTIREFKVTNENLDGELKNRLLSSKWAGKTIVTFGDSITAYDGLKYNSNSKEPGVTAKGYQSYMREELGATVIKKGFSGSTTTQIMEQIKAYDFTDEDAVTLMMGTNDFRDMNEVGTIAQIGSTFNTATYTGAYQESIEYILGVNPEIKIYLFTPIKGWTTSNGLMPEAYPNVVLDLAKLYSLNVCNLYHESGINDLTKSTFIVDSGLSYEFHPSTKGYKRMADVMIPFLESC